MISTSIRSGVVEAIGAAIERKGWSNTARASGVERTVLHRAFGRQAKGGTTLRMIERVLPALGLELSVTEVGQ